MSRITKREELAAAGALVTLADDGGVSALPAMVQRAASRLASATTAAQVLEAKVDAGAVYDAGKLASRILKAKGVCADVIAAVRQVQADGLTIEAAANRRLADEYDAAQERGEVATAGRPETVPDGNGIPPATAADLGLSRKDIHEARLVRDAEVAEPGIVSRVVAERLERNEEPTKASVRAAVLAAAKGGMRPAPSPTRRNPHYEPNPAFDAVSKLSGACQDISDLLKKHGAEFVLGGFLDRGMRERNLNTIEAARDHLTAILEAADAQHA